MENWWKTFFDADYLRIWSGIGQPGHTGDQVQGIWELLRLCEGAVVLDAPCGYGRISLPLARRGVAVVGVDQSAEMIAQAEKDRGDLPASRLKYIQQDLRTSLAESGFDAAFNVYSSIGYGTEDDDLAIFKTLHDAVRPAGLVLVDTMHRDAIVAHFSRGSRPANRLPDGTLVIEEPAFDPIEGRVNTTWYWSGPKGSGSKSASLRLYSITELIALLEDSGLRFVSAHAGCSRKEFKAEGPDMGGRVAILAERI
jgi:SAM-dependent methyltransferase